jgi:cytochrome c-type biogenesis protein
MAGIISIRFLEKERRYMPLRFLKPGDPRSAFLFGATFALGWSPCIGPILGSVLLLASSAATAVRGALLLLIFSAGFALPFLLIAAGYGHAARSTKFLSRALPVISKIGGVFLIFLGTLMLFDRMDLWMGFAFRALGGIRYERLFDLL